MSATTYAELIEESRRLLAAEADRSWADYNGDDDPTPWPPLTEPPDPAELAAVEQELGVAFPVELRELYSIAGSGIIGLVQLLPLRPDVLNGTKGTRVTHAEPKGIQPGHWQGELPEGDFIVFGEVGDTHVYIEANGPLQGRIVAYDPMAGSNYIWTRLANDMEGFLTWSLQAIRIGGGVTIGWAGELPGPICIKGGYAPGSRSQARFERFIQQLQPSLEAAGCAAPAPFGIHAQPDI